MWIIRREKNLKKPKEEHIWFVAPVSIIQVAREGVESVIPARFAVEFRLHIRGAWNIFSVTSVAVAAFHLLNSYWFDWDGLFLVRSSYHNVLKLANSDCSCNHYSYRQIDDLCYKSCFEWQVRHLQVKSETHEFLVVSLLSALKNISYWEKGMDP